MARQTLKKFRDSVRDDEQVKLGIIGIHVETDTVLSCHSAEEQVWPKK